MVFMSSAGDELPEPPWSSLRRTRRPRLTREAITEAALALVDADGLDALSMRNVAERLGVQASALYGHVSGKQELIQLMLDRVALEIELPDPDPAHWQEQVKQFARTARRVLGSHQDLAGASLANIPTGPNMLGLIDRLLAVLAASGLPRQAVAYAADLLPQFVTASVYEESLFIQRLEREPAYFERIEAYFRAAPPERFPALADLVTELTASDEGPDARFEFGLDVIVQGLSTIAARAGDAP
jgi:AcrR family transcriptional regulator